MKKKKQSISILESQFDSICTLNNVYQKWNIFENFGKLQLGRMKKEDINNIDDDVVKSHLMQCSFYIDKNKYYKEIGSKGGKATQEKNRDNAQAMAKQRSSNGKATLEPCSNQYKYKDKYKDKTKDNTYIPKKDEFVQYAKSIKCDEQIAKSFFKYYSSVKWRDKNGNIISDWKNKLKWWIKQNNNTTIENDNLPKYDDSKNIATTEEERKELLILMGKDKTNYESIKC